MTCIVGLVEQGVVHMAGDKLGSNGFTKGISVRPKVFHNGDFLIGYTTSFYMGQLLEFEWSPPEKLTSQSDDVYLYSSVVKSLRACFSKCKYGKDEEGGNFLLGWKGRLLEVQDNFSLLESPDGIGAVGSGCYHAMTSLLKDREVLAPEERLREAIKIASHFVVSVSCESDYIKEEVDD